MIMTWDFILRLFVAGMLGAVVGLDREYRAKEAGYRTHFLVALGSALIMIVSQYGFQDIIQEVGVSLDPSRVAAQVVSGIGFIGAGTIIFQKQMVRGLTTAAGLWATAGIGLAVGAGLFWLGIAATALTLVGLEVLNFFFKSIGLRSVSANFSVRDKELVKTVIERLNAEGYRLVNYELSADAHADNTTYDVSITVKAPHKRDESSLLLFLEEFQEITITKVE